MSEHPPVLFRDAVLYGERARCFPEHHARLPDTADVGMGSPAINPPRRAGEAALERGSEAFDAGERLYAGAAVRAGDFATCVVDRTKRWQIVVHGDSFRPGERTAPQARRNTRPDAERPGASLGLWVRRP